jgi:hypothetical protein
MQILYKGGNSMAKQDDLDNHANQCNPNNDEYWNSRDEEKPDDDHNSQDDDDDE